MPNNSVERRERRSNLPDLPARILNLDTAVEALGKTEIPAFGRKIAHIAWQEAGESPHSDIPSDIPFDSATHKAFAHLLVVAGLREEGQDGQDGFPVTAEAMELLQKAKVLQLQLDSIATQIKALLKGNSTLSMAALRNLSPPLSTFLQTLETSQHVRQLNNFFGDPEIQAIIEDIRSQELRKQEESALLGTSQAAIVGALEMRKAVLEKDQQKKAEAQNANKILQDTVESLVDEGMITFREVREDGSMDIRVISKKILLKNRPDAVLLAGALSEYRFSPQALEPFLLQRKALAEKIEGIKERISYALDTARFRVNLLKMAQTEKDISIKIEKRRVRNQAAVKGWETRKHNKRSLASKIGALERKGIITWKDLNSDGRTFNIDRLAKHAYFQENSSLLDKLQKHKLRKNTKLAQARIDGLQRIEKLRREYVVPLRQIFEKPKPQEPKSVKSSTENKEAIQVTNQPIDLIGLYKKVYPAPIPSDLLAKGRVIKTASEEPGEPREIRMPGLTPGFFERYGFTELAKRISGNGSVGKKAQELQELARGPQAFLDVGHSDKLPKVSSAARLNSAMPASRFPHWKFWAKTGRIPTQHIVQPDNALARTIEERIQSELRTSLLNHLAGKKEKRGKAWSQQQAQKAQASAGNKFIEYVAQQDERMSEVSEKKRIQSQEAEPVVVFAYPQPQVLAKPVSDPVSDKEREIRDTQRRDREELARRVLDVTNNQDKADKARQLTMEMQFQAREALGMDTPAVFDTAAERYEALLAELDQIDQEQAAKKEAAEAPTEELPQVDISAAGRHVSSFAKTSGTARHTA
ncbi:MAG: hypothetical protein A3A47_00630 [Candidatus Levybacteria bacterium RIFCSPLOWO2_01_FULL_37_20]|nr:MAG: hypothetical protein A2770_00020 [Candidatus Levybacteria bacterium RIFCSPHIGHO2_01_FULL_38_12]OGH33798.1 MAG: hypothetical protein A3A47_00630 [Candidatus Levybacteria bacterium RIFCSPLOWO2_01_FULL_37_20]